MLIADGKGVISIWGNCLSLFFAGCFQATAKRMLNFQILYFEDFQLTEHSQELYNELSYTLPLQFLIVGILPISS